MVDIHSHILPYIDDGSTSMHMTQDMLKEAKKAGIHCIVATPHFRNNDINRHKVMRVFTEVYKAAYQFNIQLRLGFEVHYSVLAHIKPPDIAAWCIQGTRSILLEFSNESRPTHWDIMVCDLIRNGYSPIIAHPERYTYVQRSLDMPMELKRYGCELQVDAMALRTHFPFKNAEIQTAKKLLRLGVVDYIASDAHRPEHYHQFGILHDKWKRCWPEASKLNDNFL